MMATAGTDENDSTIYTFEQAFAPLAHHLFPDGCPDLTEGPDLSSIWPLQQDRSAVPAKDAQAAIAPLRRVASLYGLSQEQTWAVTVAACETLPKSGNVGAGSPLVDGTSKWFRALVRCLLPVARSNDDNGGISSIVVMRLVSSQCDALGKTAVSRFLTLAVRFGALTESARQTLSNLYGAVFHWVENPETCMDAVRLLHAVTRRKHVRVDRAEKLSNWYKGGVDPKLSSIWLLLQLYARYDPQKCAKYFPSNGRTAMGSSAWSRCFKIPDSKWELDFLSQERATCEGDTMESQRPAKRARIDSERDSSLTLTLDWLNDAFDGVQSFSWGLAGNRQRRSLRASDLLNDTALQQLILLSSEDPSHRSVADTEVARLRACLPYMLHEEWYEKQDTTASKEADAEVQDSDESEQEETFMMNDNEQDKDSRDLLDDSEEIIQERADSEEKAEEEGSRLRLLMALASMAFRSDGLFPEAESFILEEILPHWDGSDRMGICLCHDLLPKLSPCSFGELQSKVLRFLEPLFTYGSPRLQHSIVSGTLNGLLERWGRLDWTSVVVPSRRPDNETDQPQALRRRTLREFIKWADTLFLKAFLVSDGHELLRLGIVKFFETVASMSGPFLASPSPSLVYRLLLSHSALSVDRVCSLLVSFKRVFQRLKQQEAMDSNDALVADRIAIFNCFIWDVCCFLWKGSSLPDAAAGNEARTRSICFTELSKEALESLHNEDPKRIQWALSITHGAVFVGHATDFLQTTKLDQSPDVIRGQVKLKYLEYLKQRGLYGIYSFLTTFVASLATTHQETQVR